MKKSAANAVILGVGLGLILLIAAHTFGLHDKWITYMECVAYGLSGSLNTATYGTTCTGWTLQALFQIAAVVATGGGLLIYNKRR